MQNTNSIKQIKSRILLVFVGLSILFLFVFVKVCTFNVQDKIDNIKNTMQIANKMSRASIVDRNNNIIANNIPTISSYCKPFELIISNEEFIDKISEIFPEESSRIKAAFKSNKKFIWIKRHMTPGQKNQLMNLGIPGVYLVNSEKRIYPNKNLFSHLIGYTNIDSVGISGIEKSFNEILISKEDPVVLSVDLKLQHAVRTELLSGIDEFSAKGGAAILMDMKNGEILSLASLPDFDPNLHKENDNIFNVATYGLYEPGSIAKIFNVAIGLESRVITLDSEFDISKPLKIGKFAIHDYKSRKGKFSVADIFKYSSNIGSAQIASEFGEEIQKAYFKKFGLLDKIDFELDEVSTPRFPEKWGKSSLLTISFGHGVSMTPLNLIVSVAGIVNNGEMVMPTLIKGKNPVVTKIISKDTSLKIREIMRNVVQESSGRKANIYGYDVIGKTGTSEKISSNGKYSKKANICFFVGCFDRYILLVMMDEPKGTSATFGFSTASWNAAKIAGNIIKRIGPLLNLTPIE